MLSLSNFIKKQQEHIPLIDSFEYFCQEFPYNLQNEKTSWGFYNESKENLTIESLWRIYINEQWNFVRLIDNERLNYEEYQNKIYETLNKSSKSTKLKSDLEKSFNIITFEHENYYKTLYIRVRKNFDIENKNFLEILNRHNYFVAKLDEHDNVLDIQLNQWNGKEVTKEVKRNKYIYHITSKLVIDKILKYGLQPKGLVKDRNRLADEYNQNEFFGVLHPQRVYFLYPFTPKDIISKLKNKLIRNSKRYKNEDEMSSIDKKLSNEAVLLKINLNKCNSNLRFFRDEDMGNDYSMWTSEPIPPYAISIVEMDNETIWEKIKRLIK